MTIRAFAHRTGMEVPRPELHLAGRIAVTVLAFLGIGALGGGVALLAKPDGSIMGFDVELLAGSPFTDFVIPGLVLCGVFGLGSFVVVAMGLRHLRPAPFLAFAIGCGQMIWIVVELAIIRELSFLHPVCFGLGIAIAAAAVPWGWPTFEAWRRRR